MNAGGSRVRLVGLHRLMPCTCKNLLVISFCFPCRKPKSKHGCRHDDEERFSKGKAIVGVRGDGTEKEKADAVKISGKA